MQLTTFTIEREDERLHSRRYKDSGDYLNLSSTSRYKPDVYNHAVSEHIIINPYFLILASEDARKLLYRYGLQCFLKSLTVANIMYWASESTCVESDHFTGCAPALRWACAIGLSKILAHAQTRPPSTPAALRKLIKVTRLGSL